MERDNRSDAAIRAEQPTPELEEEIKQVEALVGRMLQEGVIVSTVLIVIGALLMVGQHEVAQTFHVTSPAAVSQALRSLRGWAVVDVGLFLLILTPVMRVAVSIIGFVRSRDRTFTVITAYVLAMLILGFFIGRADGL